MAGSARAATQAVGEAVRAATQSVCRRVGCADRSAAAATMIKAMRISCREIAAIKELAKACFGAEAVVYLFGSRVDDGKRGGDIDLYIETDERDAVRVLDAKYDFLAKLKRRIGDQRIDVVVSYPSRQQIPPVVEVARRTGVRL